MGGIMLKEWKVLPLLVGLTLAIICISKGQAISGLIIGAAFVYYILRYKDE
jgi:hypothetical protein